ncbi:MAG: hypothetical protein RLZZ350_566, partial [Verrucomicrobiota bacterium]
MLPEWSDNLGERSGGEFGRVRCW